MLILDEVDDGIFAMGSFFTEWLLTPAVFDRPFVWAFAFLIKLLSIDFPPVEDLILGTATFLALTFFDKVEIISCGNDVDFGSNGGILFTLLY